MLTATYSLVAIAAEQDKARSMLGRLQQYIQATWNGLQNIDFKFLETAFNKLLQVDKYCGKRKIEVYVIPALRKLTREADVLIAELEALSCAATSLIRSIGEQLNAAFELKSIKVNEICQALDQYCGKLFTRLDKEEKELLPMARRLFSIEDWFAIASQFLSDDAATSEQRRHARPSRMENSQSASA